MDFAKHLLAGHSGTHRLAHTDAVIA